MRMISTGIAAAAFLIASAFGAFAAPAGSMADTKASTAATAPKKSMHHARMHHRTAMFHRARCRTSLRHEAMFYCTAVRHGKRIAYYRTATHHARMVHRKTALHHKTIVHRKAALQHKTKKTTGSTSSTY